MEKTFTHHTSTSRSVFPDLSYKTTKHLQSNTHTHTYQQYSEPVSCCNPALSCGDCEPRCHGNWTPHSGPWREDTEAYLSTFTSQLLTWPALVLQLEWQQTEWLSYYTANSILKSLLIYMSNQTTLGHWRAPLQFMSNYFSLIQMLNKEPYWSLNKSNSDQPAATIG